MNWTGGRLHQSRRPGSKVSAKQKAYFAKSRSRVQDDRTPRSLENITFFEDLGPELHSVRTPATNRNQRRLDEFENVAPLAKRLGGLKERTTPRRLRETLEPGTIHTQPSDTAVLLPPSFDDLQVGQGNTASTTENLEAQRKRLLSRVDWLGTAPAKPPKVSFPSNRDRDLVGRRRPLQPQELARLNGVHKRPKKPPVRERDRHRDLRYATARIRAQDEISIRVGSGIHGSQRTTQPPPKLPLEVQFGMPTRDGIKWEPSHDMLPDGTQQSSSSMLLDKEQQKGETMPDEGVYEDLSFEDLFEGGDEVPAYEPHVSHRQAGGNIYEHPDKSIGKDVTHRNSAEVNYSMLPPVQSPLKHTTEQVLPSSTPPVPVKGTSSPRLPTDRLVFRTIPPPPLPPSTIESVYRYKPSRRSINAQASEPQEPEIPSEEAEAWRKFVNVPSSTSNITLVVNSSSAETKDHISVSSGADEESFSSKDGNDNTRITDTYHPNTEKQRVMDRATETADDDWSTTKPHIGMISATTDPQIERETQEETSTGVENQQPRRTPVQRPTAANMVYSQTVPDDENEAWFKFVFARELEQYFQPQEPQELRRISSPNEISHADSSILVQPPLPPTTPHLPLRSPTDEISTRAVASSSEVSQQRSLVGSRMPASAVAPADELSTRAVVSSCGDSKTSSDPAELIKPDKAQDSSAQSVVFRRPARFEGKSASRKVTQLGATLGKRNTIQRKGNVGGKDRLVRDSIETEGSIWDIPISDDVEDIED